MFGLISLLLFTLTITALFGAAVMFAIYAMLGYRPRIRYWLSSLVCAIAAPIVAATSVWTSTHSDPSLTFVLDLQVSAGIFAIIYLIIGFPTGLAFAFDVWRERRWNMSPA